MLPDAVGDDGWLTFWQLYRWIAGGDGYGRRRRRRRSAEAQRGKARRAGAIKRLWYGINRQELRRMIGEAALAGGR